MVQYNRDKKGKTNKKFKGKSKTGDNKTGSNKNQRLK